MAELEETFEQCPNLFCMKHDVPKTSEAAATSSAISEVQEPSRSFIRDSCCLYMRGRRDQR